MKMQKFREVFRLIWENFYTQSNKTFVRAIMGFMWICQIAEIITGTQWIEIILFLGTIILTIFLVSFCGAYIFFQPKDEGELRVESVHQILLDSGFVEISTNNYLNFNRGLITLFPYYNDIIYTPFTFHKRKSTSFPCDATKLKKITE